MSASARDILLAASKEIIKLARPLIEKDSGESLRLYSRAGPLLPHVRGEVRNVPFLLGTFSKGQVTSLCGRDVHLSKSKDGHIEIIELRMIHSRSHLAGEQWPTIWRIPLADPESLTKAAQAIASMVGRKLPDLDARGTTIAW